MENVKCHSGAGEPSGKSSCRSRADELHGNLKETSTEGIEPLQRAIVHAWWAGNNVQLFWKQLNKSLWNYLIRTTSSIKCFLKYSSFIPGKETNQLISLWGAAHKSWRHGEKLAIFHYSRSNILKLTGWRGGPCLWHYHSREEQPGFTQFQQ